MRFSALCATVLTSILGCGAALTVRKDVASDESRAVEAREAPVSTHSHRCPQEMVLVAGRLCIDRYEASMVDAQTGVLFSPFYPPNLEEMRKAVNGQLWGKASMGKARMLPPVPLLPDWQRSESAKALAVSRPSVTPQGYLSKVTAMAGCEAAGKRLCKLEEWKVACRGENGTLFPYGPTYREGACNIHLPNHPAAILHGDASVGHWDPRLNQVEVNGTPLLKSTGATPTCKSTWGDDAVYDMVGNLDEWIDDAKGTFVGGFYARDTVRGCDARVSEHHPKYFDYSTGVRCCAEPSP